MAVLSTRRQVLAGGAALAMVGGHARAQAFPSKPIRFICPFPAGGIVDIAIRTISDPLGAELGQSIVVDARPGAGGGIGTAAAAASAPDGHTWVMGTISHVVAPLLQPATYDPVADFRAVAISAYGTSMAVVPSSLPVRNMAQFIAYAKARPGQLNYLNAGNGSQTHLSTELLKLRAGIDIVSVPYRGLPPGVVDLLGGRIQYAVLSSALALPHIQSGALTALGIAGSVREPLLPELQTFAEQGLPTAVIDSWFMILVPSATPDAVVARINEAVRKVIAQPAVRERSAQATLLPAQPMSPAEAQAVLRRDAEKFAALVKEAGIRGE